MYIYSYTLIRTHLYTNIHKLTHSLDGQVHRLPRPCERLERYRYRLLKRPANDS